MPENRSNDNKSDAMAPLGQYFLQEKIAQGGMAEIYKGIASDIHGIKKTVVIKKILPHIAANKEFVDMLVSEAKIAVHLNHGNIAQIYDLGRLGNDYFMVMEFVDGKSLSQIHKRCLKNGELIPIKYICYLISEVANGLDYMHHKTDSAGKPLGIVHRDISPQNLIVSYSGNVKIIDFGIAKAAFKIDGTETGILKGKFAYMSPEQARGENIDGRSDIFSLGVILHELLCGRRLFKDKDNKTTIRNVRRAEVMPPSTYNPEISSELDEIVMRALLKNRDKRYSSAGEMRDDLIKFLHLAYPDFKPASISEFIAELFSGDIAAHEEEKEMEHTPLLIIDQTQSALNLAAPHMMKEFMLEETEPPKSEENIKEEEKEPLFEKISLSSKKTIENYLEKLKTAKAFLANNLIKICAVLAVFLAVFIIYKIEILQKWSIFFSSVEISKEKPKKQLPAKFSTLNVESSPAGATIFIDDMETRHKTPATISDIRADEKAHTIGIYLEGYKFWGSSFTAKADETIYFKPVLAESYGAIEIISAPTDASVLIDGEISGKTPFTKSEVKPGTILKITVAKDGYYPLEKDIKIIQGKVAILRLQLLRLPKRPGELSVPIPKVSAEPEEPNAKAVKETAAPKELELPIIQAEPAFPKLEPSAPAETPITETKEPITGGPAPESRETLMELDYRDIN